MKSKPSGPTSPQRTRRPPRSTTMETYLSFSYRSSAQVKVEDEAQVGYLSSPSTSTQKPQTETKVKARPCEELIKDEAKLADAIMRHLERYPSIGPLRLVLDLLGPCAQNLVDTFLRYVKPVFIRLEKQGLVELVWGDLLVGIMVVNLARKYQGRGGEA